MQENNQIEEIMLKMEEELEKVVEFLRGEYAVIRAGRANPHILDKITVDYYGVPTPLNQMANMSVQEARLLVVSLFDQTQNCVPSGKTDCRARGAGAQVPETVRSAPKVLGFYGAQCF